MVLTLILLDDWNLVHQHRQGPHGTGFVGSWTPDPGNAGQLQRHMTWFLRGLCHDKAQPDTWQLNVHLYHGFIL